MRCLRATLMHWLLAATAVLPSVPVYAGAGKDIDPKFSRLGCNAGSRHGAVKGRNGFRLTLFGADPALAHARLKFALATSERLNRRHGPCAE